ncbi:MAG TPA: hypothetical protein ENG95_02205 [Nitrospirae bacterium]|nr:hypothetical protein [Nitrospirota bacterium]HDZ83843.1 hypothetical protein [Nitrospirota bacterium]
MESIFQTNMYYTYSMNQTALLFHLDEHSLRTFLENASGKKLSLVITDNSTSILTINNKKSIVNIRLHRMFLCAGSDVLNEIADYINHNRKKTPLIRKFITLHSRSLKKGPLRKTTIRTESIYHNIQEIYHSINREYFSGRVSASITWGAKRPKRAAAKRTLGSYSYHTDIIRINPSLDSKKIPAYYMEFIIYHEMLHADIGLRKKNGRRIIHSGEFKKREKDFRYYKRAVEWEKKR